MIIKILLKDRDGQLAQTGGTRGGSAKTASRRSVDAIFGGNAGQDPSSQVIVDLGAGTGTIIFKAAKEAFKQKLATEFVAVEIHPTLTIWMQWRRLFHPNRRNIKIVREDMFRLDLNELIANMPNASGSMLPAFTKASAGRHVSCYLYGNMPALERLKPNLLTLPKHSRILTYMYKLPGLKPKVVHQGKHKIFEYKI